MGIIDTYDILKSAAAGIEREQQEPKCQYCVPGYNVLL